VSEPTTLEYYGPRKAHNEYQRMTPNLTHVMETRVLPDGGKVKQLRNGVPWTQKQLAKAADVSLPTVKRVEKGQPVYLVATLTPIAIALKVKLTTILIGWERQPEPMEIDHDAKYWPVGIEITDLEFDDIDHTDALDQVQGMLYRALKMLEYVKMIRVRRANSVIVDIELSESNILEMIHSFSRFPYKSNIYKLHLPPEFPIPLSFVASYFSGLGDPPLTCTVSKNGGVVVSSRKPKARKRVKS
jgi:transcriptional regulator with XRE-family HTH domain